MFPWFPFVFPQTYRNNRRTREQISEGAFIEIRVSSGPESIASSDSSFKTETNGSSQLQICYKIRSAEDIRTKTNESILVPNLGSYSTELIDTRKACSSTILRKPVDNLNAQFFCEQSKRQNDLKMNIIERQSSPNDENRQKTTNDENNQSSKKVSGYTRPRTTIKIIHPPGGKSSLFW